MRGLALAGVALAFAGAAQAEDTVALPVPKMAIYTGDTIAPEALQPRVFQRRSLAPGLVAAAADAAGLVARRTLLPGQPIAIAALRGPHLVRQGATALAVFRAGGLTITSSMVALEAGGHGDTIRVRNAASGAVVTGVVQADGSLAVQ